MSNPFLSFQADQPIYDQIFTESNKAEQTLTQPPTGELKIKRRRIMHAKSFGRGANHPSFFLRKFYSKLTHPRFQRLYEEHPQILQKMILRAEQRGVKSRFNLEDLKETFGQCDGDSGKEEAFLNARMFYRAISEQSLQLIMEESKCCQVLNHLISIEKYSARLGSPLLTGRVEFQ